MKTLPYLFSGLLMFFVHCSMAQDSIVKLNRDRFQLNGTEFFVKAVNYGVFTQVNGNQYYLTRDAGYGTTIYSDCNDSADCAQEVLNDFIRIKNMGFNTIRSGVTVSVPLIIDSVATNVNAPGYTPKLYHHQLNSNIKTTVELNINDYELRSYNVTLELLRIAKLAGIKMILLTGEGVIAGNENVVTLYADYLNGLTTFISDTDRTLERKALLGYDIFNEPIYNDGTGHGSPARFMNGSSVYFDTSFHAPRDYYKNEVCKITEQWYNSIKSANNSVLVTIGNFDQDLIEWSTDILNIDFISFHRYPDSPKNENFYYPDTLGNPEYNSPEMPIARINDWLIWVQQNCNLPWIIGECGYNSNTGISSPPYANNNIPYYIDGSEDNQAFFAEEFYRKTVQAGASGWSWWQWHDVPWGIPAERTGLVRLDNSDKPVAEKLDSIFSDNDYIKTWRNTPLNSNNLQGNPYQYFFNQYVTVIVRDYNTNNPISNAFVRVDDVGDSINYSRGIHGYANASGTFQVYFKSHIDYTPNNGVYGIRTSAPGYEIGHAFNCPLPTDLQNIIPCTSNVYLKPVNQYNKNYSNQNITYSNNPGYTKTSSQNILELSNVMFNSQGVNENLYYKELLAGKEVRLLPGTEIVLGSNVHIGIGLVFNDCVSDSIILSHDRIKKPLKSSNIQPLVQFESANPLKVSYLEKQNIAISLTPNPATELISISVLPNEENAELQSLNITSLLGQIVYESKVAKNISEINIKHLIPGVYIIKCTDTNDNVSFHNFLKQ